MGDLVIAANRAPVKLVKRSDQILEVHHGAGGLAPSLAKALNDKKADWVATALSDVDVYASQNNMPIDIGDINIKFVVLPEETLKLSYYKIANEVIWFLYHGMFNLSYSPSFDKSFFTAWDAFRTHNLEIAKAICDNASYGATVLIHDYHFLLTGKYLKENRPDLKTAYFLHTPFPSRDELKILPSEIANEMVSSMCDFGSCGFHTNRWRDRFLESAKELLAFDPRTFVAPLGVSRQALEEITQSKSVFSEGEKLLKRLGGRKLIYRTDRMEPSKNLLRGFLAFEELLESNPLLVKKVFFLAHSYLSREKSTQYQIYREAVTAKVAEINEKFAGDLPVVELDLEDNYELSLAAMVHYDVLLVNPIRDGMNLVAKEGPIMNQNNGVVVLSKEAGAYEEMHQGVLAINPYDVSETAEALLLGLNMSDEERGSRQSYLKEIAAQNEPSVWVSTLIEEACPLDF